MDDDCNIQKVDAPLNFRAIGYGNNPSIIDANGDTVVGCSEYNVFTSRNQSANVALMIAAPELLAALSDCLAFWDAPPTGYDCPTPRRQKLEAIQRCARAAIAKANTATQ